MTVAAPAATRWSLVLPDGQQVPLRAEGVRLGREQGSCDVLLPSGKVSRTHAVVWIDEQGNPWVRDLGSANGTSVDGERITERQLRDGSTLTLGDMSVRVERASPGMQSGGHVIGDQGFVFGPTSTWARSQDLPAAAPVFDREAAMPELPEGPAPVFHDVDEGGSGGLGKLAVLTAILMLGAIVFFDISSSKVQKEVDELEKKSDLVTNRSESMRLRETHHLVDIGELQAQPVALCNGGSVPLTVDFLTGAVPVANPVPGGHVIDAFDSRLAKFNCKVAPLTIPAGGKVGLQQIHAAWSDACKLPETGYFLSAGGRAGAQEWTRAQLLTRQDPCLHLP